MTPATLQAAALAPAHPSLRWTPVWQPANRAQHRRLNAETTACGLTGTLTLAETDDPWCRTCYPHAPESP